MAGLKAFMLNNGFILMVIGFFLPAGIILFVQKFKYSLPRGIKTFLNIISIPSFIMIPLAIVTLRFFPAHSVGSCVGNLGEKVVIDSKRGSVTEVLAGKIVQIDNNRYLIRFNNGDFEWRKINDLDSNPKFVGMENCPPSLRGVRIIEQNME